MNAIENLMKVSDRTRLDIGVRHPVSKSSYVYIALLHHYFRSHHRNIQIGIGALVPEFLQLHGTGETLFANKRMIYGYDHP
jgi:hypothetical protein